MNKLIIPNALLLPMISLAEDENSDARAVKGLTISKTVLGHIGTKTGRRKLKQTTLTG
jgi:hypothetical protein